MKYYIAILTALLSPFIGAQQGFYFDKMLSHIQDKKLKAQTTQHSTISKEIHRIFNAKKAANKLLKEKQDAFVSKFRRENNIPANQPIQISTHDFALSHKDSVLVKIINQDSLLHRQFENFDSAFKIQDYNIKNLTEKDQKAYKEFYKQLFDTINTNYNKYYSSKINLRNTKFKKLFLQSELSNSYPKLENCKETGFNKDWTCFSTALKNEIQNVYTVPDYLYTTNGKFKTRTFFIIDNKNRLKAIENISSSGSFFFDMLAMDITNKLFKNEKLMVETPYLSELPLTFVIE